MFSAYPKINTLGTRFVVDIFDDEVEITEKLDGSQFSTAIINGELFIRSKGAMINRTNPDSMFSEGVEFVERNVEKLIPNMIYYCEYMKKPHHNTLTYGSIPWNHLMLFGLGNIDGTFVSSYDALRRTADILQIDTAPLLFKGYVKKEEGFNLMDEIHKLLDHDSFLGGTKIEGVVVKNYYKSLWMGDRFIPIMTAKFVSERFKEIHQATWGKDHTSKGGFESLKDMYKTEARWLKAVYSMRDDGLLQLAPQDIGELIQRIKKDIVEEEKDSIKDALWSLFYKEILGNSTKNFPEFYKSWLVNNMENN